MAFRQGWRKIIAMLQGNSLHEVQFIVRCLSHRRIVNTKNKTPSIANLFKINPSKRHTTCMEAMPVGLTHVPKSCRKKNSTHILKVFQSEGKMLPTLISVEVNACSMMMCAWTHSSSGWHGGVGLTTLTMNGNVWSNSSIHGATISSSQFVLSCVRRRGLPSWQRDRKR